MFRGSSRAWRAKDIRCNEQHAFAAVSGAPVPFLRCDAEHFTRLDRRPLFVTIGLFTHTPGSLVPAEDRLRQERRLSDPSRDYFFVMGGHPLADNAAAKQSVICGEIHACEHAGDPPPEPDGFFCCI
jgi:hypothetical protein